MSFLPPEVNSGLIYAAPGSGKLGAAASEWDCLAMGLRSTAVSYQTVIAELITGWPGPLAIGMAGAAAHYASRIAEMAARAAHVGSKAKAAAKTFETAHALTVPPLVIAANRAWFATLAATNLLGQNTQAIAATETHYLEMWAQDATALNGYVAAYHNAVRMSASSRPAASPRTEARWALRSLTSRGSLPSTFGQVASPDATPVGTHGTEGTTTASAPERLAMYPISMLARAARMCQTGARDLTANSSGLLNGFGQLVDCTAQLVVDGVSDQPPVWEARVSVQMSHAILLGGLTLPPAWLGAVREVGHTAPASPVAGARRWSSASSTRRGAAQLTLIERLAAGPWAPPPAECPPK
ncbi:PPE family protein [Mycobacterium heidelbergense]|nr:PPE family protein [Mycobacterium heidelbergense]MCV7051545.1 PPE family protein [Mycobacterium heidelbergense]